MGLMDTILGTKLKQFANLNDDYLWVKVANDTQFKLWVLDTIRQDQLFERGIDGDGDVLGYYSAFTEMLNPQKKEGTHYTLFDSGDFYRSMLVYIGRKFIEIDADPIKTDERTGENENLFYKYGENIIALTSENMDILRQKIKEGYQRELRNIL
jgi:hypothetical protein